MIFSSTLIIPDICCKNQSSHPVILEISSTVILFLSAVAILKIRSGTCSPNQPDILSLLLKMFSSVRIEASFNPERPISNERSAFWSDSWNDLPIAIASPTDFIEVVR